MVFSLNWAAVERRKYFLKLVQPEKTKTTDKKPRKPTTFRMHCASLDHKRCSWWVCWWVLGFGGWRQDFLIQDYCYEILQLCLLSSCNLFQLHIFIQSIRLRYVSPAPLFSFFFWYIFNRKVHPHSHYGSVMQQPLLTNQMSALSAHQPINVGIAHVVWPQPANKRNRHSQNRWDSCSLVILFKLNCHAILFMS